MPRVVDYAMVVEKLVARGLVSLYHNSGAFGFPRGTDVNMLGWIAADDASLRAEVRPLARRVDAAELPGKFIAARERFAGDAWLMPKSHWHFELQDGHPQLLAALLPELGIDPATLRERNDGSAIAFSRDEDDLLRHAVARLIDGMRQSDFSIVFPDADALAVVTLHHHKQIWWQATDAALIARLDAQSTQSSSSSE
jgi:hypothetical protein